MSKRIFLHVMWVSVALASTMAFASIVPPLCARPSQSTEFCRDLLADEHPSCGDPLVNRSENLCERSNVIERKKFPVGAVEAVAGVTTEERRDCWIAVDCDWDEDEETCVSTGYRGSIWQKGDMIVIDPAKSCPSGYH